MRKAGKRLAFELGPALVFFLTIRFWDIYVGTVVFMAMSILSAVWSWGRDRRLPRLPLAGIVLTLVVGGLTLALEDPQFIKMRPTIINLIVAVAVGGGLMIGKLPVKSVFGAGIHASDHGWRVVSAALVVFVLVLAGLNEWVWRSFSSADWALFKAFGIPLLDGLFIAWAWVMLRRHARREGEQPS